MEKPAATPGGRLDLLITRMVEYWRDHLEICQLLDQVLGADEPPDDFVELVRQRSESFLAELRQLIVEGQGTGEVAAGDVEQLVAALAASIEGLVRLGLHHPGQFQEVCFGAGILPRMLKPWHSEAGGRARGGSVGRSVMPRSPSRASTGRLSPSSRRASW